MKLRIAAPVLALCCILAAPTLSFAQEAAKPAPPAPGTKMSPSATYDKLLSLMESEMVSAAEAMPEDKFSFVPTTGEFKTVRSFGDQLKHVAQSNSYFWSFAGTAPLDDAHFAKLTTKADIVGALKDSFSAAHKAVATITPENAFVMTKAGTPAGMTAFGLAHMMDHYGQMVVYLRMNGIVPPASRGSM